MKRIKIIAVCLFCAIACFAHKGKTITTTPTTTAKTENFDYYFYDALRCIDAEQYDKALLLLQYCETIDSTDASIHVLLGNLYEAMEWDSLALKHYKLAIQYDKSMWNARRRYVEVLSKTEGNENEAISIIKEATKQNPKNDDAWNVLAILYKHNEKYKQAINALNQLEKIIGINEYVSLEKYRLYAALGKDKQAIVEIDRLMNEYPEDYRYQVFRGDVFLYQNQPEEAFALYQKVLKENPENPYVYISLAEYYKKKNEPEKALECILNALENKHLDIETKLNILSQYAESLNKQKNKNDELEQMLRTLVEQYPLEEQVHSYYAIFLLKNNRETEAEQTLRTMTDINPKNERTWSELINIEIRNGRDSAVVESAQKAIENLPENALMYFYKGIAQFLQKDYDGSLQTLQQGIPLVTDEQPDLKVRFYAQIGDICHLQNNHEKAYEAYEAALKINPDDRSVLNNYAYFLSNDSTELKKAERMSAQTVKAESGNPVYLDTYAWILYRQNNLSLALFYIKCAIDNLKPGIESSEIWEHYGYILQSAGETEKAAEAFEKARAVAEKQSTTNDTQPANE